VALFWNDRHLQTVCNELRLTVFNPQSFRVINDCLEPIRFAGIFTEPAWQTGRCLNADLRQDCTRIVFHFTLGLPHIAFRYCARHSVADSLTNHDPISRQRRFHEMSIPFRTEIWVLAHFSDRREADFHISLIISLDGILKKFPTRFCRLSRALNARLVLSRSFKCDTTPRVLPLIIDDNHLRRFCRIIMSIRDKCLNNALILQHVTRF